MRVRRGIDRKIDANLEGQVGVNKFKLFKCLTWLSFRINCFFITASDMLEEVGSDVWQLNQMCQLRLR